MKEQVIETDYERLLVAPYNHDGIGYHELDPMVYDRVRRTVRPNNIDRRTSMFIRHRTDQLDDYRLLALEIQRVTGARLAEQCLETRYASLHYHKDLTQPYLATNAVVVFGENLEGGELVFPTQRVAVGYEPERLITFDGRHTWHGVTTVTSGWRVSLTYYLPTYKTEEE